MAINRVFRATALEINSRVRKGSQYGYCPTAAATAEKTVDREAFDHLYAGAHIFVLFAQTNSATNPTLNISGTGAKSIYLGGAVASATNKWAAGDTVEFVYDGTNWCGFNHPAITYGSFVPVLHQATAEPTYTVGAATGRYYRIGNLCFIDLQLYNVDISAAGTGETYIDGLPFAAYGNGMKYFLPDGQIFQLFSNLSIAPVIEGLSTRIKLQTKTGVIKELQAANDGFLFLSGVYRV